MTVRRNRRHFRRAALGFLTLGSVLAGTPSDAHAGGFFIPDLGPEGLARGGAFTAKADDGTALIYNVAGLARQRGTRLTLTLNFPFNSATFTRKGTFPDNPTDETPWGGKPFPTVRNTAGPAVLPVFIVSSDLGLFDRITFSAGIFPPSAIGNRVFPLGVEKAPAASRYDSVTGKGLVLYPTLAAGFRVLPWLDVGLAGHLVIGAFDQTSVSYADTAVGQCQTVEDYRCDARSRIDVKGNTFTGSLGVMVRPSSSLQFGANFFGPSTLRASGTASATPPAVTPNLMIKDGTADLEISFPWQLRLGGRYISMDRSFELWDLEADVTYEAWASAQNPGPTATIQNLGMYPTITATVLNYYKNTFSMRLGGAYNMEELDGIVTLRGGAYYDSSASESSFTRLGFDTLAKIAGTMGVGYKRGGVAVNLAYAAIASVPRSVSDGRVKPVNGTKMGKSVDANDNPLPATNNGEYSGFTHSLSLGLTLTFDEFFGGLRKPVYGDPSYEELAGSSPKVDGDKGDNKDDPTSEKKKDDMPDKTPEKNKDDPGPDKSDPPPAKNPTAPGTTCKWGEC